MSNFDFERSKLNELLANALAVRHVLEEIAVKYPQRCTLVIDEATGIVAQVEKLASHANREVSDLEAVLVMVSRLSDYLWKLVDAIDYPETTGFK